MSIPCVFIHLNNIQPLEKTIPQALKFNNEICVIGNEPIKKYCDFIGVKFFDFRDFYSEKAKEFDSNYVHMSSNSPWVEKICFIRWYILNDFIHKQKLNKVFYSDSDVMLYCNIENTWENFEQYNLSIVNRACGSTSFWTREGSDNFCKFTSEIYNNKNCFYFNDFVCFYENLKKFNMQGGVCDMTLLDRFHQKESWGGPPTIGEMTHVINESTFDQNINSKDGVYDFNNELGIKNIEFIKSIPYCYHKNLNKKIKFNALHFQGGAKRLLYRM
jgi:hypothetical protein